MQIMPKIWDKLHDFVTKYPFHLSLSILRFLRMEKSNEYGK